MLRDRLNDALKVAMKARDKDKLATLRLILAALKDRDLAARAKGQTTPLSDEEILALLSKMIRQRRESIKLFQEGGRTDLAESEAAEIAVIEEYLPKQLSEAETETAVRETIERIGAHGIKDMGRTIAALKESYPGRMDFAKASALVRKALG